jgi:hypothetical protein
MDSTTASLSIVNDAAAPLPATASPREAYQRLPAIDLFSGIGALALSVKDLVEVKLYTEINQFCQGVLAERMEEGKLDAAPIHPDVRTLHVGSIQPVVLCGGFPCTDLSTIGLLKGITPDTASGLFLQIVRMVDETPSIKVLMLENVSHILKCGLMEVTTELTKRNFKLAWKIRSASQFGAPHLRKRWLLVAIKRDCPADVLDTMGVWAERVTARTISEDGAAWAPGVTVPRRAIVKPAFGNDPLWCDDWIARSGTIGNTVVWPMVRRAFAELIRIHGQADAVCRVFDDVGAPVTGLSYPFPECGIVVPGGEYGNDGARVYAMPTMNTKEQDAQGSTIVSTLHHRGKAVVVKTLPTPRHCITSPCQITDRSIRDLPVILAMSDEALEELEACGLTLSAEALEVRQKALVPNPAFLEWMMGLDAGWTKGREGYGTRPAAKRAPVGGAGAAAAVEDENEDAVEDTDDSSVEQQDDDDVDAATDQADESSSSTPAGQPQRKRSRAKTEKTGISRINGFQLFVARNRGKGLGESAAVWRELPAAEKAKYSADAKAMYQQSVDAAAAIAGAAPAAVVAA